jgi:hypothetical protein
MEGGLFAFFLSDRHNMFVTKYHPVKTYGGVEV